MFVCIFFYHGEGESACDLAVVVIPLLDLWLAGCKVGADEADAGGMEEQADGHTSFVACGPAHASLDSINSNVPGKHALNAKSHIRYNNCRVELDGPLVVPTWWRARAAGGWRQTDTLPPAALKQAAHTCGPAKCFFVAQRPTVSGS